MARVRAENQIGWGLYSSQNSAGVIAQSEPTYMSAPIMDESQTTDTSIRVYWQPITADVETGATIVTSYSLEWDQATGDWFSLVGE
jgi:hypothetical protein